MLSIFNGIFSSVIIGMALALTAVAILQPDSELDPALDRKLVVQNQPRSNLGTGSSSSLSFIRRDGDGADDTVAKIFVTPGENSALVDGHYKTGEVYPGEIKSGSTMIFAWNQDQFDGDQSDRHLDYSRPFTWMIYDPETGTDWLYYLQCKVVVSHEWKGTANYTISPGFTGLGKLQVPDGQKISSREINLSCGPAYCNNDKQKCDRYPYPGP